MILLLIDNDRIAEMKKMNKMREIINIVLNERRKKMKNLFHIIMLIVICSTLSTAQNQHTTEGSIFSDTTSINNLAAGYNSEAIAPAYKFSISTTYLSFDNFGKEETNVHMYEFHIGYRITPNDKIGIKVATWKLFGPMGIQLWDPLFLKESEWYPGRIRESGIGITYQRLLWKGLFAQIEILPLWKTYLDKNNTKIDDGFKLYTSYHVGYHISFFENRLFIEPQIHCNYWPVNSRGPQGFEEKDRKWNNYFLFEPNLFIGFNY